jgi:hypothetical protein
MQKINVYADETGQDTQGGFFLVAVVIVPADAVQHFEHCELVSEKESGRSARKWRSSNKKSRTAYLGCLLKQDLRGLRVRIRSYRNRKDYTTMTAETIAAAIQSLIAENGPRKATIMIDGMNDAEIERVRRTLKASSIRYRKIRGPRDEGSPMIRVADSLAGMARMAAGGDAEAQYYEDALANKGILVQE